MIKIIKEVAIINPKHWNTNQSFPQALSFHTAPFLIWHLTSCILFTNTDDWNLEIVRYILWAFFMTGHQQQSCIRGQPLLVHFRICIEKNFLKFWVQPIWGDAIGYFLVSKFVFFEIWKCFWNDRNEVLRFVRDAFIGQ